MQMRALFKKNASFQSKRTCSLCCTICSPIIFIMLMVLLQYLINTLFLSKPSRRCPYCGPESSFTRDYCSKESCWDFFFPDNSALRAQCQTISQTCTGTACYQRQWASSSQLPWCPWETGKTQGLATYVPGPQRTVVNLATHPVLYTGQTQSLADSFASTLYEPASAITELENEGLDHAPRNSHP